MYLCKKKLTVWHGFFFKTVGIAMLDVFGMYGVVLVQTFALYTYHPTVGRVEKVAWWGDGGAC